MTQIITLDRIRSVLERMDVTNAVEQGFAAYSRGEVVVPPVGELVFEDPPGDTHIKYGYVKGGDTFVIKIASGFYNNPQLGLTSCSGLMLVFSQKTGLLKTILLDEGYLTDVRTAMAGRIAATYLKPQRVQAIGVIGTGIQARMQAAYLTTVTDCRTIRVWGRTPGHADDYRREMERLGFEVHVMASPGDAARESNLIITATPSISPLLKADDIQPGTHITAMGSDTQEKQELDVAVLEKADLVVADSISQCRTRGEISKALEAGVISESEIVELGTIIMDPGLVSLTERSITVADLTGVAVQDVEIAAAVCAALEGDDEQEAHA